MLVTSTIFSTTEYRFEERTSTGCTTDGKYKTISGYQLGAKTFNTCKTECQKYEKCKGIRVAIPGKSNSKTCRLLTGHNLTITGWDYLNQGNWVEPKNWKHSPVYDTMRCLEKIKISML